MSHMVYEPALTHKNRKYMSKRCAGFCHFGEVNYSYPRRVVHRAFVNVRWCKWDDHLNDLVTGEDGWLHSSCLVLMTMTMFVWSNYFGHGNPWREYTGVTKVRPPKEISRKHWILMQICRSIFIPLNRKKISFTFVEDIGKFNQVFVEKSRVKLEKVVMSRQSVTFSWFGPHCSIVLVA